MKSELNINDFTLTQKQIDNPIRYNSLFAINVAVEDYKSKIKNGYYNIGTIHYFSKDIVIFRLRKYCVNVLIKREIIVLHKGIPIIHSSGLSNLQLTYLYHFIQDE